MKKRSNPDELLDQAVGQILTARLEDAEVDRIADRVWSRLAAADAAPAADVEEKPIRSCDDYQGLLPAFVAGTLSTSRRLLVESHTRECVPCRKALNDLRSGATQAAPRSALSSSGASQRTRWALAATLVAAIGLGAYGLMGIVSLEGRAAVVEASDGQIFRLAEVGEPALAAGAPIELGERVRTGPGESALLRLEDGSVIEVRERSWLAIEANRRGTTIDLERGSVIVQAAPQRDGRLYVATGDCLVSVKGTIFSVNHGTKGSRVSVIEGEVMVDSGGEETLLQPGQQVATHASLAPIPVSEEISWSRDVDRYIALMREVSELRRALSEGLTRPDLRYDSRLIDLVPADATFYVALPNLAETIAEADQILRERVAESRLLKEWWESREGAESFGPAFDSITDSVAEFGGYLGDEVVVTARMRTDGTDVGEPLVLAELRDAAGLRRFVEEKMAEHAEGMDGEVVFVDESGAAAGDAELYVWLGRDTLIAAPELDSLRAALGAVSNGGGFRDSRFGQRVADAYREGAGVLIGADLARFTRSEAASREMGGDRAFLEESGLLSAEHFMLEQKWVDGKTQHRAVLAFDGPRQGMAAWLAEPAPMGALEFVSPDAKFLAAFVLVDPSVMVADLVRIAGGSDDAFDEEFRAFESELGVSVKNDVAIAFGGEVAMAVDGPLLPEPSWKVVLEVYDPVRVEFLMNRLVLEASDRLVAAGKQPIELVREESGGRTFWSLDGDKPFHFTMTDGYLIAAPNRALLDRALRYRQSGYTIATSSRFRSLLPTDGNDNFSAVFYQDAMGLLEPLAERIAAQELTESQREAIESLTKEVGPTLGYAYGQTDRIVFAASGTMNLLDSGLPGLLGMGASFDMDGLFRSIMTRGHGHDEAGS